MSQREYESCDYICAFDSYKAPFHGPMCNTTLRTWIEIHFPGYTYETGYELQSVLSSPNGEVITVKVHVYGKYTRAKDTWELVISPKAFEDVVSEVVS